MKRLLVLIPVLLCAVAIILAVGCKEEDHTNSPPVPARVTVNPAEDTICFIPGEIPFTVVTVTVEDQYGNGMAGLVVDISLSDTVHGRLEYADSTLRNTTNASGQVGLIFFPQFLDQYRIVATLGSVTNSASIWTAETDFMARVVLHLSRGIVHLSESDTVTVVCSITNGAGNGIPDLIPEVTVTGGNLTPFAPTDSSGNSRTLWQFTQVGLDSITACHTWEGSCHHGTFCDTDSVQVLP